MWARSAKGHRTEPFKYVLRVTRGNKKVNTQLWGCLICGHDLEAQPRGYRHLSTTGAKRAVNRDARLMRMKARHGN